MFSKRVKPQRVSTPLVMIASFYLFILWSQVLFRVCLAVFLALLVLTWRDYCSQRIRNTVTSSLQWAAVSCSRQHLDVHSCSLWLSRRTLLHSVLDPCLLEHSRWEDRCSWRLVQSGLPGLCTMFWCAQYMNLFCFFRWWRKILIILGIFSLHYLSIINFLNVMGLRVSHPSLFCVSNTFQRHSGWKLFCTLGSYSFSCQQPTLHSCYTSRVHYFILYKFLKFKHIFFWFYFPVAMESVYNIPPRDNLAVKKSHLGEKQLFL